MSLLTELDRFFTENPVVAGDTLIAAYSGGLDSTALLWGLEQLRRSRGFDLLAVHVDHAIDSESSQRAERARRLCERFGAAPVGNNTWNEDATSELPERSQWPAAARRAAG